MAVVDVEAVPRAVDDGIVGDADSRLREALQGARRQRQAPDRGAPLVAGEEVPVAVEGEPEGEAPHGGGLPDRRPIPLDAEQIALGIAAPDRAVRTDSDALGMVDARLGILPVEEDARALDRQDRRTDRRQRVAHG